MEKMIEGDGKKKTEWDLSPLLEKNIESQIKKETAEVKIKLEKFIKNYKNQETFSDLKKLKQALEDYEEIFRTTGTCGKVGYGLYLLKKKDSLNDEIKKYYNQVEEFEVKIANEIKFFILDLGAIPKEKQQEILKNPDFIEYQHFLEDLFNKAEHFLSEEEEKILSLKQKSSHENWVDLVKDSINKEEREVFTGEKFEKKNFPDIQELLKHTDEKVRDSAAEKFNEILKTKIEIATAEINSIFNNKKVNDELRKYKRADSARIANDEIDEEFIDSLLNTLSKRLDISKRFYLLKAKLFGKKQLKYHERNIPYGEVNKVFEFEEGTRIVLETLKKIDENFEKVAKDLIENARVDVYSKKGKNNGAFCAHNLINHPTYVLLNYQGKINDLKTMAHEFGHAINNEFMKKQKSIYFGSSLAIAEVASTFMEDFVHRNISTNLDEEEQLIFNVEKLGDEISSIIRQLCCYKFELELHTEFRKEGYLTSKKIGEIFLKNMEAYMGEGVEQSSGSENWWIYWSHIRSFFYVYSYSSGILISKALQKMVRKDPKNISKVKEIFSLGSSLLPREIFQKAGIELNQDFWNNGLDELENLLNETEALAIKLGKIK